MIARAFRFHGINSLRHVYRRGQTVRTSSVSLRYMPSNRKNYRVAVVVSRKVSKSAVVRNKIRRRIYEIIRASDIKTSTDMVFTVFSDQLAQAPHKKLEKIINGLLKQAGVI